MEGFGAGSTDVRPLWWRLLAITMLFLAVYMSVDYQSARDFFTAYQLGRCRRTHGATLRICVGDADGTATVAATGPEGAVGVYSFVFIYFMQKSFGQ